jgi:hypothetical protein
MERTAPSRLYRKAQELDSHIARVTGSLDRLFQEGKKQEALLRKRRFFYSTIVMGLVAVFIIVLSPRGTAETAMFYPKTCLGGWHNPHLASGEPETDKEGTAYTDGNSSLLDANESADIFCGNFLGEIPKDTVPNGVVVRILMSYDGSSSSTQVAGENFENAAATILDTDASTTPDFTLTEGSTAEASSSEIVPSQEDTPSEATDTAPQSFLKSNLFFSYFIQSLDVAISGYVTHAYAQDISAEEVAADEASSSDISVETDTSAASTSGSILNAAPESQLFEILYTLDGTTWRSLGVLSKNEVQGAQFAIPLATSSTWLDITRLQVEVKRLPSFDDVQPVYLDGMSLEVTYGKQQELHEELSGDPKRYDIAISTSTSAIQISEGENGEGSYVKIGTPNGGQLFVYSQDDGEIKFSMGVGSDPASISSYIFDTGNYTAVMTNRVNGCVGLSLLECQEDKAVIGWSDFSIIPTRDTPTEYLPGTSKEQL